MPRSAKKNHTKTPAAVPDAPTGLPYGEHQALVQEQQATNAATPPPSAGPPPAPMGDPMAAASAMVGQHAGLTNPTARPDEPVTAGLPSGPGAGPEALGPAATNDPVAQLRAIYAVAPNPDLLDLITHLGT